MISPPSPASARLQPATQDRRMIATVATQLMDLWLAEHAGARLRLLGVAPAAADAGHAAGAVRAAAQRRASMRALDAVRQTRFGKQALRRASSLE